MRTWYYIACIITCILPFTLKAGNNIMFDKANQLYHNKNYDSAAKLYQQMIDDGYCSSDLYYNTGNAYYRLNKIGMAIWCYEKAITIKPEKNYIDNLALAKQRIKEPIESVNEIFFIRWWQNLYQLFSVNKWAILALSLFSVALLLLFLKRLKHNFNIPSLGMQILFGLSAYSLLMLFVATYHQKYHYRAVVIESKTLLTNEKQKEPMFVNEGIVVTLIKNEGERVLVKLPDGREGKLSRKSLKKI